MRILVTDFFGIMAGSTYSACYLGEALQRNGHQVWMAHRRGSFLEELLPQFPSITPVPFTRTGKLNLSVAHRLSRWVQEHQIEVILCQASPDRYHTVLARWLFGMPGKLIHTRRQKPLVSGGRLKARLFSRGTDQVIAVSQAVKNELVHSGMPATHVRVINNGLPDWKWKVPAAGEVQQLQDRYHISPDDLVIGCVARIKKQRQLVEAASRLEMPFKLIFVGIEDRYADLRKAVAGLPSQCEVIFTGEISNQEVMAHYPLMSMMVLPSDMEGLSQAILEAMAQGVPVIATDASGNPEVVIDGQTGLLFQDGQIRQLEEVILRLGNDREFRQSVIENARKLLREKFRMERVVEQYERLFQSLMKG